MQWPKWITFEPLNTRKTILGPDPIRRGHTLFYNIMNAYNANLNDLVEFTRQLNNIHSVKIGDIRNFPVYCVMKDSNKPENPWEMIELIGDDLTMSNTFTRAKDFSVKERIKCINYVTKANLCYEFIPDDGYTVEGQSFFVYKMKTAENDIHDDFYLIESNKVKNGRKDEPSIKKFVEFLNQPTDQNNTDIS
jgi:hypothetical protein